MLLYTLYKLEKFCASVAPRKISVWLARRAADIFFLCDCPAREAVIANLTHVLASQGVDIGSRNVRRRIRWLARETFENFAIHIVDFLRIDQTMTDVKLGLVTIENMDYFTEARARGRGVIFTTAHIGNWEVGAAVMNAIGHPVYTVAQRQEDGRVDAFFAGLRKSGGIRVLPGGRAARRLFKLLKDDKLVALVADRVVDGGGVPMKLFEREVMVPRGPAEIAARSGAPVIPTFLIQSESGLSRLVFESPIEVDEDLPTAEKTRWIDRRLLEVFERYITMYPSQWFTFYKVWK